MIQEQCYASILGDGCSRKMTYEHPTSECILEYQNIGSQIRITGFRRQREDVEWVSPKKLAYRVLCKHHNSLLSPLDKAAKSFHKRLIFAGNHLIDPETNGQEDHSVVSGQTIERWLAKSICALWAGGDFARAPGWNKRPPVNAELVTVAFGRTALSFPQGLYIGGSTDGEFETTLPFSFEATYHIIGPRLAGAAYRWNGINMTLNLTTDQEELETILPPGASYHPPTVTFIGKSLSGKGGMHFMTFDWDVRPGGKSLWIIRNQTWQRPFA